jgi:hypothetical protein
MPDFSNCVLTHRTPMSLDIPNPPKVPSTGTIDRCVHHVFLERPENKVAWGCSFCREMDYGK